MFRRIAEEHGSFVVEKKALERAKRRMQIAESKVEAIPHWAMMIERAINEYRASRSQFASWLDSDFPRAVAVLSRMISDLEAYVRLAAPVDEHSPIALETATPAEEAKSAEGRQKIEITALEPGIRTPNQRPLEIARYGFPDNQGNTRIRI